MDPIAPILWLLDRATGWQHRRRHVRVLVHRGVFLPASAEHFFLKITNLSASREVEVTHIWFATEPAMQVVNPTRPLPVRLRLDETFETWIPAASVPQADDVERLGRVLLSTGKILKSRLNRSIPPLGNVAGRGGQ